MVARKCIDGDRWRQSLNCSRSIDRSDPFRQISAVSRRPAQQLLCFPTADNCPVNVAD